MDNPLNDLENAIDKSIDEINALPNNIVVGDFDIKKLKAELDLMLANLKLKIKDIEIIDDNIQSVRNIIIDPVRSIIQENSKDSKRFNYFSLGVGLLGLILTVFSFVVTGSSSEDGRELKERESVELPNSSEELSQEDLRLAESYKLLMNYMGQGSSIDSCKIALNQEIREYLDQSEQLFFQNTFEDEEIQKMIELVSAVYNGSNCITDEGIENIHRALILLNFKIKNYKVVLGLFDLYLKIPIEKKQNLNLLRLYKLEAQYLLSEKDEEAVDALIMKLNQIKFKENGTKVPCPDFSLELGNRCVEKRLKELEHEKAKKFTKIWIFNSKRNDNHINLAKIYSDLGFENISLRERKWSVEFLKPYIYCVDRKTQISTMVRVLKDNKYCKKAVVENYKNSNGRTIPKIFEGDSTIQYLIIL